MPRRVLAAGIVLWLTVALVHAQGLGAQPYGQARGFDPNAPTHDVSGSVINTATGEPIPRALVQMFGPSQRSDFTDSQGLQPLGNNVWAETSESGPALVGTPNSGSLGVLQSGAVEESNVDLTAELVNMITAQRVYQANAQTIKAQDTIMQTLVSGL